MKTAILFLSLFLATSSARAGELVMFETEGCPYCAAWKRDIGQHYGNSDLAALLPLKRIDIKAERPKGYEQILDVKLSPTFVAMACGAEAVRFEGYSDSGIFWDLMDMAAAKVRRIEKEKKC
ncbi:MAG: thioredoxin family protein [Alphaproteobacteria bacterium]|nr:thioredoxin family protein [Alphaproteobacteria bacterium]